MKKVLLLTAILLGITQMNAQVTVTVSGTSGSVTAIDVDATGEIYISGDRMVVLASTQSGVSHTFGVDTLGKVTFSGSLPVHQVDDIPALRLYPNPAAHSFAIGGIEGEGHRMWIYNAAGELVMQQVYNAGSTVDISALPQGIYMVRVDASVAKLVKR